MTDQRNFRSTYLVKVGIKKIDEKKSIEILMKESPLDLNKLRQFCLKFQLPVTYRLHIWKILLGILPPHECNHEYVWSQRTQQYHDLESALKVMQIINDRTLQSVVFLHMFNLEHGEIPFSLHETQKFIADPIFLALANVLDELSCDPVEIYWLTTKLYERIGKFEETNAIVESRVESYLQLEDTDLCLHLKSLNVFSHLSLDKWFHCAYAGIVPDSAFVRICDKVIGGSSKILIYVAVAILLTFKRPIMCLSTSEQVQHFLDKIPEDSSEMIVARVIEIWERYGSQLMPIRESPSLPERSSRESPSLSDRAPS